MKKLLFIPVTLALLAPLAACTSNNPTASASIQAPTTQSSPSPETTVVSLTRGWHDYTAKDGSYSAKFPGKPKEQEQSANSPVGQLKMLQIVYEDRAKDRAYMTQTFKIPVHPSQFDVEKGLDGGVASQAKDGKTLIDQKKIVLHGLPGREVTLRDREGVWIKMRSFIDPKGLTMYTALVAAGNEPVDFPEVQAFLDSVSILQK